MTKQLKWRLGKLPTPDEVLKLVNDKLITKEEAREILFSEEKEVQVKESDLKAEIKFLKELVERLATRSTIVETIRYIEKPYYQYGFWQPYQIWCGGSINTLAVNDTYVGTALGINSNVGQALTNLASADNSMSMVVEEIGFSQIK